MHQKRSQSQSFQNFLGEHAPRPPRWAVAICPQPNCCHSTQSKVWAPTFVACSLPLNLSTLLASPGFQPLQNFITMMARSFEYQQGAPIAIIDIHVIHSWCNKSYKTVLISNNKKKWLEFSLSRLGHHWLQFEGQCSVTRHLQLALKKSLHQNHKI